MAFDVTGSDSSVLDSTLPAAMSPREKVTVPSCACDPLPLMFGPLGNCRLAERAAYAYTHTHTHTYTHTHPTYTYIHTERERERDGHRHTDTQKHADTQTHGHTETDIDTEHTNIQREIAGSAPKGVVPRRQ